MLHLKLCTLDVIETHEVFLVCAPSLQVCHASPSVTNACQLCVAASLTPLIAQHAV